MTRRGYIHYPREATFGSQTLIFGTTVLYVLNAALVPVRFSCQGWRIEQ